MLTISLGFEIVNERSLSFFDARIASKFYDAKKICEASTRITLICQREPGESLCPYYKGLRVICKKLWNRKRIHSFFGILKFHSAASIRRVKTRFF